MVVFCTAVSVLYYLMVGGAGMGIGVDLIGCDSLLLVSILMLIVFIIVLIVKKTFSLIAQNGVVSELSALRAAFNSSPYPVYVRDSSGRLIMCNSRYLEITGKAMIDVVNKKVYECAFDNLEKSDALSLHEEYLEVLRGGEAKVLKRNVQCKDGNEVTVHHWLQPYRDSRNRVLGLVGGWVDITEQESLLDRLRIAKNSAEDANRAKTIFLAVMSHELRTPLSAVIGLLEVALNRKKYSRNEYKELEVAFSSASDLLDLLSDILDMSRIEAGNMSLVPVRTNFVELLDSVVDVFTYSAREKGLKFTVDSDLDDSFDVILDPVRVKQIFTNLLSNAFRYTDHGEVVLGVKLKSDGDGAGLWFCVQDTGRGISDRDMDKLFSPFSCVGNSQFGSGLGLVITRSICEMMGGQLNFSSRVGVGTKVEVFIRLDVVSKITETGIPVAENFRRVDPMHVLVVDDYPASRHLFSLQLNRLGHSAELAKNGLEAFEKWKRGHFDAVLTDCNMPEMTGYELACRIREYESKHGRKQCLISGFTAGGNANEEKRCIDAGMNACLFKPVSFKDLGLLMGESRLLTVENDKEGCAERADGYVELNNLSYLSGFDKQSVCSLLSVLLSSNREDARNIDGLVESRNYAKILDAVHRVKGGCKMIGAKQLIQCCNQVELACMESNFDSLVLSVASLKSEFSKLESYLQKVIGLDL